MDSINYGFGLYYKDHASKKVETTATAVGVLWKNLEKTKKQAERASRAQRMYSRSVAASHSIVTRAAGGLKIGGVRLAAWASRARMAATATGVFSRAVRGLSIFLGARLLIGGLRSVINTGREFEQTMAEIRSVISDVSEGDMRAMTARARELGRTTAFTAQEAAEGMRNLAQAGHRTSDIIRESGDLLNLAAVGSITLAESAEVLDATLKQFNLSASHSTEVVDAFAAAATSSSATVSRLALGFRQTGGLASSMGLDVRETAAILGVFHQAGTRAARAGTAMRNMLLRLVTPSENLTRALQFAGTTMEEVNPRTNDFADIMERLAPLVDRPDMLAKVFGVRTAEQLMSFLRQGGNALRNMREEMDSSNTAAAIYAIRMGTMTGRMMLARSALQDIQLELYETFVRPILFESMGRVVNLFNAIQRAIHRLRPVIAEVVRFINWQFQVMSSGLMRSMSRVAGAMRVLTDSTIENTAESIQNVVGPLVLWVTVMSIRIRRFLEGFSQGFMEAWGIFTRVARPMLGVLGLLVDGMMQLAGVTAGAGNNYRGLGRIIGFVLGAIVAFKVSRWFLAIPIRVIQSVVNYTTSVIIMAGRATTAFRAVAASQSVMSIRAIAYFSSMQASMVGRAGLTTAFTAVKGAAMSASSSVIGFFSNPVVLAIGAAIALIAAGVAVALYWQDIVNWWNQASDSARGLAVAIGLVLWPLTAIVAAIALQVSMVRYLFGLWWEMAEPLFGFLGGAIGEITTAFRDMAGDSSTVIGKLVQFFRNIWRSHLAALRIWVAATVIAIGAAWLWFVNTAWPAIQGLFRRMARGWERVKQRFLNGLEVFGRGFENIINWIARAWNWLRTYLIRIPIMQPVIRAIDSGINKMKTSFRDFLRYLRNLQLPAWLSALVDWVLNFSGSTATNLEQIAANLEQQAGITRPSGGEAPEEAEEPPALRGLGAGRMPGLRGAAEVPATMEDIGIVPGVETHADYLREYGAREGTRMFTNHFHEGAVVMRSEITDTEDFARRLYPVMESVAREQEERGG